MTDINTVVVCGRLTNDLGEHGFGYLPTGTAKASFNLAINRSRKSGDEWVDDVSYIEVVIFGKTAENLKPYLKKGKQLIVEGSLKQDRWEKDGKKQSKVYILANTIQMVGGSKTETKSVAKFEPIKNEPEEFQEDIPF